MTARHDFYHPVYWPTWLGFCVLRTAELLPYGAQLGAAALLGRLLRYMPLPSVRIARRNIELCMPALTATERSTLLEHHCQSVAMSLCEVANAWWSSDARIAALAHIEGLGHLRSALTQNAGVILLGGHFTTLEIVSRMLGGVAKLNVLYRPPRNALLAHATFTSIKQYGNPIAHDDVAAMLHALKRNEVLCYAHGNAGADKTPLETRLFGQKVTTTSATTRLSRLAQSPVLTFAPERLPGDSGYRITLAPLANFPSDNPAEDVQRFNAWLEQQILRVPEQYLWTYPRFAAFNPAPSP